MSEAHVKQQFLAESVHPILLSCWSGTLAIVATFLPYNTSMQGLLIFSSSTSAVVAANL